MTLNASKTMATAFHLNNREARRSLQLDVKDAMNKKFKTRNNIIAKLPGTSWGCNANVLRISTLALVYSVAEYCSLVWMKSVYCNKIDVQLNQAMQTISGTVKSTQTQWLPVLSN